MVSDDGKEATVFQVYPTQSEALDGPGGALTPCLQLSSRVRKCRPLCRSELMSLGGSQQGWTVHRLTFSPHGSDQAPHLRATWNHSFGACFHVERQGKLKVMCKK